MLANRSGISHIPTIVTPCHGMRTETVHPMPFSSTPISSQPMSTSNSYPHSSYLMNPVWSPLSASILSMLYLGSPMKPGKYRSVLEETTPSTPNMSRQWCNEYKTTMKLWHCFATDRMIRGEPVLMPFGLHYLRNSPQPIGEIREGIHEELRLHIPGVKPKDHVPAEQFDNQLDQALLLVNYIQTRMCVFKLIDKLEVVMEKLADIALGLKRSSTHGTH